MVEPRSSEAGAQLLVEALVFAEHDAGDHRPALAREPRRARPHEVAPQPVGEPSDTAPLADDPVRDGPQDDVHALAAQVRRLVEAVLVAARTDDADDCLDDGALRRRPFRRKLEAGGLGERSSVELPDPHGHARRELAAASGPGHLEARERGAADVVGERASVEMVEAEPSPPPAGGEQGERERRRAVRLAPNAKGCERDGRDGEGRPEDPPAQRDCQAECERRDEQVRTRYARENGQSCTTSLSCASRAGPMPGMASSSSSVRKPPCFSR